MPNHARVSVGSAMQVLAAVAGSFPCQLLQTGSRHVIHCKKPPMASNLSLLSRQLLATLAIQAVQRIGFLSKHQVTVKQSLIESLHVAAAG